MLFLLANGAMAQPALMPPPGYRAAVQEDRTESAACLPVPTPYVGDLQFPSKYDKTDPGGDAIDPVQERELQGLTARIVAFETGVSGMVDAYMRRGDAATLDCVLRWLVAWSDANAMTVKKSGSLAGDAARMWAMASVAASLLRLKFSESAPLHGRAESMARIEQWLGTLADRVVQDWKNRPLDRINNLQYWAAWSVMAAAVLLDRRDLFDWSVLQYQVAALQVDRDGYLPNELARQTRAFVYHNYAVGPLAMLAAFLKANGVDVDCVGDRAVERLARRVYAGIEDRRPFEQRARKQQVAEQGEAAVVYAWLEPYCATYSCDEAWRRRAASLRPMRNHRLGGDLTALFGTAVGVR